MSNNTKGDETPSPGIEEAPPYHGKSYLQDAIIRRKWAEEDAKQVSVSRVLEALKRATEP
jgi:hypothetical protein